MNNDFSLYIHIPFCISKCSYCDFFSVAVGKSCCNYISDAYVDALCEELSYKLKEMENRPCSTVYIGGGTPSLLSEVQLNKICSTIYSFPNTKDIKEFTIEVNPDDVSENLLQTFEKAGINRISCGIQSMNEASLKRMNRRAGRTENLKALEIFKTCWKGTLSLDLISSLPLETEESFFEGLNLVVSSNPHHISLYSLTIEEETPLGKELNEGSLDYDFDAADLMWIKGRDFLEKNGYFQYEISNFAKPGFNCLHNMTYWKHKDYLGCGCGAAGSIYSRGKAYRTSNKADIDSYINYWLKKTGVEYSDVVETEEVDYETSQFEFFMMGLRTLEGVSEKDFYYHFKKDVPSAVKKQFAEWEEKNLAEIKKVEDDVIYRLNHKGILFLNTFLEQLEV